MSLNLNISSRSSGQQFESVDRQSTNKTILWLSRNLCSIRSDEVSEVRWNKSGDKESSRRQKMKTRTRRIVFAKRKREKIYLQRWFLFDCSIANRSMRFRSSCRRWRESETRNSEFYRWKSIEPFWWKKNEKRKRFLLADRYSWLGKSLEVRPCREFVLFCFARLNGRRGRVHFCFSARRQSSRNEISAFYLFEWLVNLSSFLWVRCWFAIRCQRSVVWLMTDDNRRCSFSNRRKFKLDERDCFLFELQDWLRAKSRRNDNNGHKPRQGEKEKYRAEKTRLLRREIFSGISGRKSRWFDCSRERRLYERLDFYCNAIRIDGSLIFLFCLEENTQRRFFFSTCLFDETRLNLTEENSRRAEISFLLCSQLNVGRAEHVDLELQDLGRIPQRMLSLHSSLILLFTVAEPRSSGLQENRIRSPLFWSVTTVERRVSFVLLTIACL